MMEATRKIVEDIQRIRKRKQTLLDFVRAGYEQAEGMTQEEAIKTLIADIAECDEAIAEILQEDARVDIECRARFFT